MGGSKPGFYQASPVTEGIGYGKLGKERSSLGPSLWVSQSDGHLALPQLLKKYRHI